MHFEKHNYEAWKRVLMAILKMGYKLVGDFLIRGNTLKCDDCCAHVTEGDGGVGECLASRHWRRKAGPLFRGGTSARERCCQRRQEIA